ncbi:hypothetical protein TNCV_1060171 [Trichonephila clavipes]|nr:hypothetical protein TNCV_1060171 [Trichonephila clavipes]
MHIQFKHSYALGDINHIRHFPKDVFVKHGSTVHRQSRCSDLALRDFHAFLHFKKFLSSGERFNNDEELKTPATRWFHSKAAMFNHRVIQKLIPLFDKYPNSSGGYVEK